MRFALRTLFPVILLATAVLACNAATYYVSTDGDDSNPGTAQLPWRSIDAGDAAGRLLPGDRVIVREGVYLLSDGASINLAKCSGEKDKPITYKADGLVVIQGGVDSESTGFQVSASYITLTGFRIRSLATGITLAQATTGNTVSYCAMTDIGSVCIHDQGGKNNLLHHDLLYCCGLESVSDFTTCVLASSSAGLKVYNNTMVSFGIGVWVENSDSGAVEVVNNIIHGMRTRGLQSDGSAPDAVASANNIFYENAADTDLAAALGDTDKVADPRFVNPDECDYRLDSSSIAIDAGKEVGLEFEGSAPDIGAFETARISDAPKDGSRSGADKPVRKPGFLALSPVSLTYYVSTSGNDSNNGLTPSTAWATIGRGDALRILRPGDTVQVSAGTYAGSGLEGVSLVNCSGTASLPITYRGVGTVVISRSSYYSPSTTNTVQANGFTIGVNYITLDNFEITNAQFGVYLNSFGRGITVKSCRIHLIRPPDTDEGNTWLGQCAGIFAQGNDSLLIRHNAIYDIGQSSPANDQPCFMVANSSNVKIHHNTMVQGRYAVQPLGNCRYCEIYDNIFTGMRGTALTSAPANLTKDYNLYYNNGSNFGAGISAGAHEYFGMDPKFGVDYVLQSGSTAIDAGLSVGPYGYIGSAPDLGYYETGYSTGTTYYVKPATSGGNDSNNGTSLATAWATISRGDALGVLNPGDTVVVAAGTYAQGSATGVTLSSCSGNATAPITYTANGTVVIDQTSYSGPGVFCVYLNTNYTVLDGFELVNAQFGAYSGDYKTGNRVTNCRIHDMRPGDANGSGWNRWSGGIYNSGSIGNMNDHNVIYNIGTSGVDYWSACIMCPVSTNVKIYNNTLAASWAGVLTWASPTGTVLKNNIISHMWKYGLYYNDNPSGAVNEYNLFYSNTTGNYGGYASAGTGESTANPNYVNYGTKDFHLQSGSPAINMGIDLGLGWVYYGSAPDKGRYEYDSRTTYYVKPNGSDALDGKSLANAWQHIDHGDDVEVVKAGDTVKVYTGTYAGSGSLGVVLQYCSGNPTAPITYEPYDTNPVVIDRDSFHNPGAGNDTAANGITMRAGYTIVKGFEVKNSQWGISDSGGVGNQIINCKIHDMSHPNTTADNSSEYAWCGGIVSAASQNLTMRNNVIYNIGSAGSTNNASCIETRGTSDISIYNNTLVGGRFGINGALNPTKNVVVKNNIFSDARSVAITYYLAAQGGFVHSHNLFWNNPSNYGDCVTAGQREFVANPRYTNAGTYDYQLLAGSPAINSGTNLGYTYSGPAPDLGAYETNYATSATTYYVKTNGNDNLDGTSLANAWATIGRGDALGVLNPGDTVIVAAGTYAQASATGVTLANCYGSPTAPITYQANGSVVIDQSGYTGALGFDVGVSYVVLDGFEICNAQYGVRLVGTGGNTVTGCVVKNCRIHDILPAVSGSMDMWESLSAGIYCYYGNDNTMRNNVIYNVGTPHLVPNNGYGSNNLAFGIGGPGCSNTKVYNNTLVHGLFGLFGWGSSYGNQFRNNIAYENWGWGLYTSDSADCWTNSYNLYYSTHGGSYTTYGGYSSAGPSEQTVDPVFVNAGSNDYHLQSTSPAINAGCWVDTAYNGSAPDEGAYETNYTSSVYYVATNGNDANNGTSLSTPWLHIDRGDVLGVLKPGDTVIVSPGTYVPADYWGVKLLNCSGVVNSPITYRASGAVCIDQTGVSKPANMSFGIFANVNYTTFDGFEIKGSQWGVYSNDSKHDNTVVNCLIHDLVPGNSDASDWFGWCGGIYFSANTSGTAHHNATYNIGTSGVDKRAAGLCVPSSTNIKLYNNTCVNAWAGLSIWGSGSSGHQAVNNAFTNNWKYGIRNDDVSGCLTHTNNIFYSNTTADYSGNVSAGVGEFTADPLYTNYATRNLILQASSPAVDTGLNVGYSYLGASPDLGAYESTATLADNWAVSKFEGPGSTARPFSFYYNGSAANIANWTYSYSALLLDSARLQRTNTYTAPDGKLQVRCVSVEYTDFPAIEWTVYFKNVGGSDTSILTNIWGCDMSVGADSTTGAYTLHCTHGGEVRVDPFRPESVTLSAGTAQSFEPTDGISSDGWAPFWNLTKPNNTQILIGLGWSGTWNAIFTPDYNSNVGIKTGLDADYVNVKLHAGEEIRTPLTVMLFASGTDRMAGQNLWRKFVLAHYSPTWGGAPYDLPVIAMADASQEAAITSVETIARHGYPVDFLWMDAGWYEGGTVSWLNYTGNWTPDPTRFPTPAGYSNGMKPISDAAHAADLKFILWMESERIMQDPYTELYDTLMDAGHSDWLITNYPNVRQQDLGNPACLSWMESFVMDHINSFGLDHWRVDWNMNPIHSYVNGDDLQGADRHGITENLYQQGFYKSWDDAVASKPDMLIDNCAGGGRRLDMETLKRAVVFWRADVCWDYDREQAMEHAYAMWLPLTGRGDSILTNYGFRSGYGVHVIGPWGQTGDAPATCAYLHKMLRDYLSVKDCFYGDFHPLSTYNYSPNEEADVWYGWQFDRPDVGDGVVQAFRRKNAAATSYTYYLKGLQPDKQYVVTNVETGAALLKTGAQLMNSGLTVSLPVIEQVQEGSNWKDLGASAVFKYQRQ